MRCLGPNTILNIVFCDADSHISALWQKCSFGIQNYRKVCFFLILEGSISSQSLFIYWLESSFTLTLLAFWLILYICSQPHLLHLIFKINLTKTKVMFTTITGESIITVQGTSLAVVETITYLGYTLTIDVSLDAEIHLHIQRESLAYGMLEKWLWAIHSHITHKTKMNVYRFYVLSVHFYLSETLLCRHLKILKHFNQKCLKPILNIQWNSKAPYLVVLTRTGYTSIESLIITAQIQETGHIVCMRNDRLPKHLLSAQLHAGKHLQHWKRYKEFLENWFPVISFSRKTVSLSKMFAQSLLRSLIMMDFKGKTSFPTDKWHLLTQMCQQKESYLDWRLVWCFILFIYPPMQMDLSHISGDILHTSPVISITTTFWLWK